jgi:hypothetical protein
MSFNTHNVCSAYQNYVFDPIVHLVPNPHPSSASCRSFDQTLCFCHRAQCIRAGATLKRRAATSLMGGCAQAVHRIHEDIVTVPTLLCVGDV